MHYETILFSIEEGIARLVLNRPSKLNSFSETMHREIADAMHHLTQADNGTRVLLITGAGRAFCAGQDLSEGQMSGGSTVDLGITVARYYEPLVRNLRALPIPVIAAVNGVAAGAGANFALACDIVVAKSSAFFLQPFVRLGLQPDTGGTYFLPRLVGSARAMGLSLLGDKLSAEQAEQWGLIWKSIPDEEFETAVEALARRLASGPSLAHAHIKQSLQASMGNDLDQQLALERESMRTLGNSEDYIEGVGAFLEKREPDFNGR
ncbi:2-(1,2-epoxy-1,2-dihydrophenyl)acetyl-CoA isomerase PaaG [Glaciimonas sp. PCH181]|uniref:2-(1,2-epoxy-1,2-dihydrophenyl)acetyl-CoA isomerase PaaG n=1 Tax=Glaciimonas sp. PCH181 TaxID=2133943 RepID=UPI000D3A49A5|nr:2-(1,2-epoxy-1,2-dihydrophenyl)acetyl-CoA isomerase PaaG [Glaciimonas sp. PCH181]PUA19547.1 2-(1,2-epoxy-1,2-dihydrophenyl)acetyl-CoA isomerase [Glaciimonas sp. PCH181]